MTVINRQRVAELVDDLRKNLLYQTPQPHFARPGDEQPEYVKVKIAAHAYLRIMEFITQAGGWTLPQGEKQKLLEQHEKNARRAYGDGVTYDLRHLSIGEIYAMYEETEGISELEGFRVALAAAIDENGALPT